MDTYGERLQYAMDLRKQDRKAVAKAIKRSVQAVGDVIRGNTNAFTAENNASAADFLEVNPSWLATGAGDMLSRFGQATSIQTATKFGTPTATLSEAGSFSALSRVAVVGTARLGDNGYYEEISSMAGAGDGSVLAQSDDPNAYALRVRGDSMFPAIRDGWYVVIEPNATPTPGEYVLIKLRDGQKMVKELILQRADSITVVSVNGDKRRTIMSDEIDNHYGIQAVVSILAPSKWRP